jgi:hypothetical protein
MVQKMSNTNNCNNNEKVLMIGNRLANLNVYRKNDVDPLNNSQDHLESLLQHQTSVLSNTNSIRKNKMHSSNSLHVDSAVSISGGSQQSTPHGLPIVQPTPPPPPPAPPAPPAPIKDDAQIVDFVSSFLFPVSFIIFNIIYWMV